MALLIKLKRNFQDKKAGMTITLATDSKGKVVDPYWERRLREHNTDGADQWFDVIPNTSDAKSEKKDAKAESLQETRKKDV